jgi:NAD(P)-dependent dehydrogenase (short-subunit alcohol dehydrogenase family)
VKGDLTSESSISAAFESANRTFGPPSILIANAGITDESAHPPIWEINTELWDRVNSVNVRGTFLTIKHFLLSVKSYQEEEQSELENVSIVVTGSETGKFGQEGHAEYASGKAGLQYGLVRGVKNEIVRLNSTARINAVAPGWVDTPLIGDRLDDPKEMWAECQSTYVQLNPERFLSIFFSALSTSNARLHFEPNKRSLLPSKFNSLTDISQRRPQEDRQAARCGTDNGLPFVPSRCGTHLRRVYLR